MCLFEELVLQTSQANFKMFVKAIRLFLFFDLIILVISATNSEFLTRKGFFSAAKPDEASPTTISLKSFLSPSELACSQKCLRHDQCNFQKYNPETKQCELLSQINKDDLNTNAFVSKKGSFTHEVRF